MRSFGPNQRPSDDNDLREQLEQHYRELMVFWRRCYGERF
jgi:hypothetical protein